MALQNFSRIPPLQSLIKLCLLHIQRGKRKKKQINKHIYKVSIECWRYYLSHAIDRNFWKEIKPMILKILTIAFSGLKLIIQKPVVVGESGKKHLWQISRILYYCLSKKSGKKYLKKKKTLEIISEEGRAEKWIDDMLRGEIGFVGFNNWELSWEWSEWVRIGRRKPCKSKIVDEPPNVRRSKCKGFARERFHGNI